MTSKPKAPTTLSVVRLVRSYFKSHGVTGYLVVKNKMISFKANRIIPNDVRHDIVDAIWIPNTTYDIDDIIIKKPVINQREVRLCLEDWHVLLCELRDNGEDFDDFTDPPGDDPDRPRVRV